MHAKKYLFLLALAFFLSAAQGLAAQTFTTKASETKMSISPSFIYPYFLGSFCIGLDARIERLVDEREARHVEIDNIENHLRDNIYPQCIEVINGLPVQSVPDGCPEEILGDLDFHNWELSIIWDEIGRLNNEIDRLDEFYGRLCLNFL